MLVLTSHPHGLLLLQLIDQQLHKVLLLFHHAPHHILSLVHIDCERFLVAGNVEHGPVKLGHLVNLSQQLSQLLRCHIAIPLVHVIAVHIQIWLGISPMTESHFTLLLLHFLRQDQVLTLPRKLTTTTAELLILFLILLVQ